MWFEIYLFIFTTKKENTFVASEQDIKELFIHKIIIIDINFFLIIHKKKKNGITIEVEGRWIIPNRIRVALYT